MKHLQIRSQVMSEMQAILLLHYLIAIYRVNRSFITAISAGGDNFRNEAWKFTCMHAYIMDMPGGQ